MTINAMTVVNPLARLLPEPRPQGEPQPAWVDLAGGPLRPLYSAYVWAGGFVAMTVTSAGAMAKLRNTPFKDFHRSWAAPGMAACVALTGSAVRVTRHRDFDPERRGVFCLNHVNELDGHLASWVIPHPFCGLQLAWHFKIPAYGWMMRMSDGIPVYPHAEGRTAEITAAARERISRGLSILAFPEAHRTLDGKVRELKRGVFFMARDAGIPVIPMAARGMYSLKRKGDWRFRPAHIEVFIGPPIETEGLDDAGVADLAERVRRAMVAWVEEGRMPTDDELYG